MNPPPKFIAPMQHSAGFCEAPVIFVITPSVIYALLVSEIDVNSGSTLVFISLISRVTPLLKRATITHTSSI
jgi:hypothetical protein